MEDSKQDAASSEIILETHGRGDLIVRELIERNLWFVQLRWWVGPAIVAGTVLARPLGFEFDAWSVAGTAGLILAYNSMLHILSRNLQAVDESPFVVQRFTYLQVGLDYIAMFLLIHYTGGAASPFIFFFIFHIIFASILLPPSSAYGFAALASLGMAAVASAEYLGVLAHHALYFKGNSIDLAERPVHVAAELGFFAASVFITAYSTTSIMNMLGRRILKLAELTSTVETANQRFNSLLSMVHAIGAVRDQGKVLNMVTEELACVMDVNAVSVKLLSNDGKYLRYAAGFGLPTEIVERRFVEVERSPLNKSIIMGEPFATGQVTRGEMFQFGEDLASARIRSVLFAPLLVNDKVIGILGAYCSKKDRFKDDDVEFFRLAAGLVAMAIDNARSYESVETLMNERSWFMMRVAHNLRAPLAAVISMIDVVREGSFGELNAEQSEYLRRVDRRSRTMLELVNELMSLAGRRDRAAVKEFKDINLSWLAGRIERTFVNKAEEKGIDFKVGQAEGLPPVVGNPDDIEQLMENLVSNAVKYTPEGGKVEVNFSLSTDGAISMTVSDTGIGIPRDSMGRLFTEFFRAPNAKQVEEVGTGLGLAIAREIVTAHGGRIKVESEEGCGTIFLVNLPRGNKKDAKDGS